MGRRIPGVEALIERWQAACGTRSDRFAKNVQNLSTWVGSHGRLPKQLGKVLGEAVLAGFLNNLQQLCVQSKLSEDRRAQLLEISGMEDLLKKWDKQCEALAA